MYCISYSDTSLVPRLISSFRARKRAWVQGYSHTPIDIEVVNAMKDSIKYRPLLTLSTRTKK